MISCYLIGKDTSVCVRFFTSDVKALKQWIDEFKQGPCHVHCHEHIQPSKNTHSCEIELKTWLTSSSSLSAVMLLDPHLKQISEPIFLEMCAKAKKQGVFTVLFTDGNETSNLHQLLQPNWTIPRNAPPDVVRAKVNEILGVVRFTPFMTDAIK